jgi:asparagine synthase (glutamine-hydrolysing)
MCGFSGCYIPINKKDEYIERIRDSLMAMGHRGPDGSGLEHIGCKEYALILGHVRLSIVDLSSNASQPMQSTDRQSWIVFNGEIYNYLELRKKYWQKLGFNGSEGDTRVLIELLSDSLDKINEVRGMFSLIFYDGKSNSLHLMRDWSGKKPLYFYRKSDYICFSSETKALRKMSLDASAYTVDSIREAIGLADGSKVFSNIFEVNPGEVVSINLNNLVTTRNLLKDSALNYSFTPHVDRFDLEEEINNAVKIRLRGDVPIGLFLSGGVDSSLIAAIIAKKKLGNLTAFSIEAEGEINSEASLAENYASKLGLPFKKIQYKPRISDIDVLISKIGEPIFDSAAVPLYHLSKFASNDIKVVLTGDGGDELFGEYRRIKFLKILRTIDSMFGEKPLRIAKKLLKDRSASIVNNYLEARKVQNITEFYALFNNEIWIGKSKSYENNHNHNKLLIGIEDLYNMMVSLYLPRQLNKKTDMMTMQASIEARCPLLDVNLMRFSRGYSIEERSRLFLDKPLLRDILEKYVGHSYRKIKKTGFKTSFVDIVSNMGFKEIKEDQFYRELFEDVYRQSFDYLLMSKLHKWQIYNVYLWLKQKANHA